MATRPQSTRRAHLGLLITTAVTAAALMASAVANQLSAAETADTVTRARAEDVARAARGALRQGRDAPDEALAALLDEWGADGLRFVAAFDEDGSMRASAGTPVKPVAELARRMARLPPGPELERDGAIIRVLLPIRPGRAGRPRAAAGRPPRALPAALVVELEPIMAEAIIARARLGLAISGLAALALLVLAAVFWRMSGRAAAVEAELIRDRHLATLGEMSAVLGHEIRNPLASLKGHAQLLVERLADDPRALAKAERVVAEAVRLERLTTEVLEFSRSGAIARRDVSPSEVLRRAAEVAGEGRVTLADAGAPVVFSLDGDRLEQVLVNLIRNALQASPEGANVEASVSSERRGGLRFEVRDHGTGISAEGAARLFEPFHTTKVNGTGLGLAVARRIVEAHGGAIEALNHPDGGALLTVRIPAA
jgi:two-component system sensor histidine kinase HydH